MSDDPGWDDMDYWPGWTRFVLWLVAFILLGALLLSSLACSTALPTPEEVIPCTPVLVYPPEIPLSPRPALTSSGWTREQVSAEPASFGQALARDLAEWIGWALGMEADVRASNEARPGEKVD